MIKIKLQITSVKSFFESNNFMMKFMTTDAQSQSNVSAVHISLYDLCLEDLTL